MPQNKEYIDREALLVLIEEAWENARIQTSTFAKRSGKTLWHGVFGGINYCRNRLLEAPAADVVEVRRGFWVEKQIPLNWCEDDVDVVYMCSICGNDDIGECRYCPNCGAKMDKEE